MKEGDHIYFFNNRKIYGIAANDDVIDQIMKYVDWINQEYAHGDYSMIEAYVVAADFPDSVVKRYN